MKKVVFSTVLLALFLPFFAFSPNILFARADNLTNVQNQPGPKKSCTSLAFGLGQTFCDSHDSIIHDNPRMDIAFNAVQVTANLLGLFFLALFVYAGYKLLTWRKNKEQFKAAKKLFIYAIIGLVIVILIAEFSVFLISLIFPDQLA